MTDDLDPEIIRRFGEAVDFGKTAGDYAVHRAGFPAEFFERLDDHVGLTPGAAALDIGSGTGAVARGLAARGLEVLGVDPAGPLLEEARALAAAENLEIAFEEGAAEALPAPDAAFDLVVAGQCWHWFDRPKAAAEAARVLRPGGRAVVAHFDWLPLPGTVVEATERLILEANPGWALAGGTGFYPQWPADLWAAGFREIETRSFDWAQPYTHEAWRGRIRASAGVKAHLSAATTEAFDGRLAALLAADFTEEPLLVPHRVWWATARKAG